MRRFLVQNSSESLWISTLWYQNKQHFISMIRLLQEWYLFFNMTPIIFSLRYKLCQSNFTKHRFEQGTLTKKSYILEIKVYALWLILCLAYWFHGWYYVHPLLHCKVCGVFQFCYLKICFFPPTAKILTNSSFVFYQELLSLIPIISESLHAINNMQIEANEILFK